MPNKLNKEEFDQGLTLQDLRVIIHALKMQGLSSSVDPIAEDSIKSRIADLPSAETLLKMAEEPLKIKAVVKEVGEIMHFIESYPKSNTEYRDRHQVLTGLPPRYKVLEWRKNMNKADSVKTLVKLSENLDEKGQGSLSKKIIACAKKIRDEEKDESYFNEVEKDLIQAGFNDEAKLMKEAINPAFDPRNWFNKERREKQQTIWQGDKAQQERERKNLQAPAGLGNIGDPNRKEFDKRKEDAVGKLLNLHRENSSIIKQIETLNARIKEFNETYEVTGLSMQDIENSINTTHKYLQDLGELVGETAKKMKGQRDEAFDYSPLRGQPAPAAAAPAAAALGNLDEDVIKDLLELGYDKPEIAKMTDKQAVDILFNNEYDKYLIEKNNIKPASRKTNIKLAKISLRK